MSFASLRGIARGTAPSTYLAVALVVVALFALLSPMLADFSTYGFHDWDVETAYRYITVLSLKRYHEGPWWQPFLCGGVPAFGQVETASNLFSPYLPLYLWLDLRTALRLEVVGDALIGIAGSYLLAGRFTKIAALRAAFALLTFLNGRFALQAAVGHTWHLQYAWTPWVFFFFLRASDDGRLRQAIFAGACLAGVCFWGGIYPLPQTALFVGVYAVLAAISRRSTTPLLALAATAAVAIGLSAPKLFAVADQMQRLPRLIDSKEVIGLSELLVMLTDPEQAYGTFPVRVPAYNWHEWGLYVGPIGLAMLVIAIVFGRELREQLFKICGLLCLLLGFGAFHEWAPWRLLHELPVFASQHVPSRYHYLMLFFLGLTAVATLSRWLTASLRRWRHLDVLLLVPVALFALDLVRVNHVPFSQAFWMQAPAEIPERENFEHRTNSPVNYVRRDWAGPMLLAMMANTGVIRCYGADPALVPAAIAADQPNYRGQAYVVNGPGTAEVVKWSPNTAVVRVSGARPGELVAYNMNYDPSWRANGAPAEHENGRVAARLSESNELIEFTYFPRSFQLSIPIFVATLLILAYVLGAFRSIRSLTVRRSRPSRRPVST